MRRLNSPPDAEPNARGSLRSGTVLLALVALLILPSPSALAQDLPGADLRQDDPITALSLLADTSDAGLRVERARLNLAQSELRAVTGWRRWRPAADFFVSMSTRGLAFPSISSQGYDPAYAAIARWPGDTWGVTLSWSIDQVLDRRPVDRARNAVAVAEARIEVYQARREQQQARDRERVLARAEREADRRDREVQSQRRADLVAAQLRIEADFLTRRLDAQRELLRLAEMKYEQSEIDYEALARSRLAVLSAEHACATNAARLATLSASGDPTLALYISSTPERTTPDDGIPPIPRP